MSITVNLAPATRSGTCASPIAALSLETIAFTGAVIADHTQVMVMLPDGSPLALGETINGVCEINLKTKEAHSSTAGIAAGELVRCVLVIGDTNTLRYVVPAQLQRNYLDDVIPPTESVPSYPTKDELDEILAQIPDFTEALASKQDKLIAGENIMIAEDGKTISATGGGGVVECDDTLLDDSTNPIQNQWLGKRMGATETNSVQIGYNAKAGTERGATISDGDNGYQVAVGRNANGNSNGAVVGYNAIGYSNGAVVGYNASGTTNGAAVGRNANGNSNGAAVGYYAIGNSYGAAIGHGADGSNYGAAIGHGADGYNYSIAVGYNSTANHASYTATIGVDSSNSVQYSLQISAYNNAQQTFFAQRLIAGETLDDSYIEFYHRDRVSSEFKGRRISATNFFALLDANGATDISSGGGDYSGDYSA